MYILFLLQHILLSLWIKWEVTEAHCMFMLTFISIPLHFHMTITVQCILHHYYLQSISIESWFTVFKDSNNKCLDWNTTHFASAKHFRIWLSHSCFDTCLLSPQTTVIQLLVLCAVQSGKNQHQRRLGYSRNDTTHRNQSYGLMEGWKD